MAINVFEESVVTLTEAARLLPKRRGGRSVHVCSIYRWVQAGLKSKSGVIIHLETVRVGGTTCTSKEALQRFFDRLQDASSPTVTTPHPTSRDRERRIRQAERELRIGSSRVFETSTVSSERLCDLQEHVERKMPGKGFEDSRAYFAIRHAIFEHAVRILEGKEGRSRSMEAAMQWVDGLDLLTMDVGQLHGIGSVYELEWKLLIRDPARQALLSKGVGG